MIKNPDILFWAGKNKKTNQYLVGFALETNDALEYGRKKLKSKNLDAIIINSLQDKGAGFATNTNKISILDKEENLSEYTLKPKTEVALDVVNFVAKEYSKFLF